MIAALVMVCVAYRYTTCVSAPEVVRSQHRISAGISSSINSSIIVAVAVERGRRSKRGSSLKRLLHSSIRKDKNEKRPNGSSSKQQLVEV